MQTEERILEINPLEGRELPISPIELLIAIWQRRRFVLLASLAGVVLASGIAMLIPNEYTSTAQLMPPDQATISGISTISMMGGADSLMPRLTGSLMSARTPGQTVIGILTSRTEQDDLVNRFDLLHVYHAKFHMDARKKLAKNTAMVEDKKSGLLTITVTDTNAVRARDLAKGYVDELNTLLSTVSASSARKERVFLEGRLKLLRTDLDATSLKLSEFASNNATIDPRSQGVSAVASVEELQMNLAAAQAQLADLKSMYSDNYVRVIGARARIAALQKELQEASGRIPKGVAGAGPTGNSVPSLREIPILGATYNDLYRQMQIQEQLYEALTKQYELAKVEEAKEVAGIKVLDEPEVPERKSFPHRLYFAVGGALLFALFAIAFVVASELWKVLDDAHPAKVLGKGLLQAMPHRRTL